MPYSSESARMLAAERPQLDICCYQATPVYELRLLLERTEERVVGMRYSVWGHSEYWIWVGGDGRRGGCQTVRIFYKDAERPREAKET